ncbi:hypothetical protein PFICI_12393 [Pestalotiopsis fici W106-1]|uniref:Glutathione S-transferase n=1 Tax=Pestalotiopsis fici (strain W106-1 / CGMCC3.15140) TaxID=1229662 RepID=W3WNS7_PESFW|nr:uncharacterized protein PFICI_12393 [Pestalotiopsis fici W106-1]ETS75449.1 hypothetical protein PFICI_12393 [Pestalotiopsis fici W106-1]
MRSNPRGLVPTLEVAPGKALYESNVLLEYLEDAYPESQPLRPTDPFDRARSRIWSDFVTSRVIPAFHRLLQFQTSSAPDKDGEARLDVLRGEYRAKLLEFARAMDPEGPLFAGSELTTVDIVMAPWALRSWVFERFKGGLRIPEPGRGGGDEEAWARWRTWLAAVGSRESVRKTTSEEEYYVPIYQRYADDIAQSELAKATRDGRGVP